MKEIVAEVTHLARRSNDISQRSGVSVRVSICNYESLLANALRRSIRLREQQVAPRVSDLTALVSTTGGKIELESVGETTEEKIVERLVQRATLNVFNRHFSIGDLGRAGQQLRARAQHRDVRHDVLVGVHDPGRRGRRPDRGDAVSSARQGNPALVASAMEFVLEGLHLHRKLNKDRVAGTARPVPVPRVEPHPASPLSGAESGETCTVPESHRGSLPVGEGAGAHHVHSLLALGRLPGARSAWTPTS